MTKLEEKLQELGYEQGVTLKHLYFKEIYNTRIMLWLNKSRSNITKDSGVLKNESIYVRKQQEIYNLQQAFNEMQRDLEVLKEYEKCN